MKLLRAATVFAALAIGDATPCFSQENAGGQEYKSAAEKTTAIGPSGPPPAATPGAPPTPPAGPPDTTSAGASGSRPTAAASGAAATPSHAPAARESTDGDARPAISPPGQEIAQIRDLYQKFVQAYQSKNLNSVLRAMTPQWQASDGSGLADLEDTLRNSFRVFDVIQFRIEGLQVQKAGADTYNVSYAATLIGRINRLNVKHEETSNVQDVVKMTPEGPRIIRTNGNVTIKAK